jgi:hypothetical protein
MSCFVFAWTEDGLPQVLFFDGTALRRLEFPDDFDPDGDGMPGWGEGARGGFVTAILLCHHCGVPASILVPVAELLRRKWVWHLSADEQVVPEWVVRQEMLRCVVQVMSAAWSGTKEGGSHE